MTEVVPHVAFTVMVPASTEWPHPPGFELATSLRAALESSAIACTEPGNWRDIGWSFVATLDARSFELYFALAPEPKWLLAIAPVGQPGLLARLLGRKPLLLQRQLRIVAGAVHRHLSSLAGVSDLKWCFNGHPVETPSVAEPELLAWAHEP